MVAIAGTALERVAVAKLRPTQMTVGLREVKRKRSEWHDKRRELGRSYIETHMIPAILGPKDQFYIVDHHHLARALFEEGIKEVLVIVLAKLDMLKKGAFWVYLDNRTWVHPFDKSGQRRTYDDIPHTVAQMDDDPFRSVAGELRRAGGFAKDATPYTEFLWADALRSMISTKMVKRDFDHTLELALKFARSSQASYLPGWCGPHS